MKTTIDTPDGLYHRCKDVIQREHTSLKSLVEEGLSVIVERHENPESFVFSPITFGGFGIREEFSRGGWDAIREEIYSERGSIGSP